MKILRAKKKCGKCEYLANFPNVHCRLDCKLQNVHRSPHVHYVKALHPLDCTNQRQRNQTPVII